MAKTKKFYINCAKSGRTLYTIIRRKADGYYLDSSDGNFVSLARIGGSLTEDTISKSQYIFSENRTIWTDGIYIAPIFHQRGSIPNPTIDTIIAWYEFYIYNDEEYQKPANNSTIKEIDCFISKKNINLYAYIRRENDGLYLDRTDGVFKSTPSMYHNQLTEDSVIKGFYTLDENRTVWTDGTYTACIYQRRGALYDPSTDRMVGDWKIYVIDNVEVPSPFNSCDVAITNNSLIQEMNEKIDKIYETSSSYSYENTGGSITII